MSQPEPVDLEAESIYTVLPSGSMVPTFDEHYILHVRKLSFADIKVGDVILANPPERQSLYKNADGSVVPYCHRVIRKSSAGGRVTRTRIWTHGW